MSEAYLLLLIILALGLVVKNKSLMIAVAVLLVLKLLRADRVLEYLDQEGLQWGIIVMMIGLMAPIAMGEFGFDNFVSTIKEPMGIIAVIMGVVVTIFARQGVIFLGENPLIVGMSVSGIILGVIFFKGVPIGPLVAAGVSAVLYSVFKMIFGA